MYHIHIKTLWACINIATHIIRIIAVGVLRFILSAGVFIQVNWIESFWVVWWNWIELSFHHKFDKPRFFLSFFRLFLIVTSRLGMMMKNPSSSAVNYHFCSIVCYFLCLVVSLSVWRFILYLLLELGFVNAVNLNFSLLWFPDDLHILKNN